MYCDVYNSPLRTNRMSVGPQWRIVYIRFWESGIAGIIASYFIQKKIGCISLSGLQFHHIFFDNLIEVYMNKFDQFERSEISIQ